MNISVLKFFIASIKKTKSNCVKNEKYQNFKEKSWFRKSSEDSVETRSFCEIIINKKN